MKNVSGIQGYTENQKLKYIGKGFLGFDVNDTEMMFHSIYGRYDIWVMYKGEKMLVRKSEVI